VDEITSRLVAPFYLRVLHGNMVSSMGAGERDGLLRQMRAVAPAVTFGDALQLWPAGWRQSLMASWWAAVWRWPEVVGQVEPLLIPSRSCFEGQAHCLALAQVNSRRSRAVLVRYLDEYLPRPDLRYDQSWAMAALTVACAGAGEPVPSRCEAAWRQWSRATSHTDLGACADTVRQMLACADSVLLT
jgi:hypothetical protein